MRMASRSSLTGLAERFSAGTGRFTIGITGREGITYHVHLTAAEARRFVAYVDERVELNPSPVHEVVFVAPEQRANMLRGGRGRPAHRNSGHPLSSCRSKVGA